MLYGYYKHGEAACRCRCECGNECIKSSADLRSPRNPPHCGCKTDYYKAIQSERSRKDITGLRFGSLIVDEMIYEPKKHTRVKCTCDCGNKFETALTNVASGNTMSCGCYQRQRTSAANKKDFTGIVSNYGVVFLREDKKNSRGVWLWICQCPCCGKEFSALPAKVLNGHITSCGCAKRSSGERFINDLLIANEIDFDTEHIFKDCVGDKPLRFDFFLPQYNATIEYQGEQHYRASSNFGGEKEFQIRQRNDQIKRDYCKEKQITLLELPYTLSCDDIKEKILSIVNP